MTNERPIKPLFILAESADTIGTGISAFSHDNYNRELGSALINAENDAEAISIFLNEYKDSPETLRSYAKEVERLLLWCIHVAKVNISSLRRNHLTDYQDFLKNPLPQKIWCGTATSKLKKDGTYNPDWRPFVNGLSANSIKKSINNIWFRLISSFATSIYS